MSISTKKKHVIRELMNDDDITINERQFLAMVLKPRGNFVYEVQNPDGEQLLISMPSKFRNTIFVKHGSLVIAQFYDDGSNNKVNAEIVKVLMKDHVKQLKKDGIFPSSFEESTRHESSSDKDEESDSSSSCSSSSQD